MTTKNKATARKSTIEINKNYGTDNGLRWSRTDNFAVDSRNKGFAHTCAIPRACLPPID